MSPAELIAALRVFVVEHAQVLRGSYFDLTLSCLSLSSGCDHLVHGAGDVRAVLLAHYIWID